MADFFKTSTLWVIDFHFDGRARRWFRAFGPDVDVQAHMAAELQALHGKRASLVAVRKATDAEESMALRGDEPKNLFCPTGRHP